MRYLVVIASLAFAAPAQAADCDPIPLIEAAADLVETAESAVMPTAVGLLQDANSCLPFAVFSGYIMLLEMFDSIGWMPYFAPTLAEKIRGQIGSIADIP